MTAQSSRLLQRFLLFQSYVLSFLGSSAVALVKHCRSKVKLQASICSLFFKRGVNPDPFWAQHHFYQEKKCESRAPVLQTRCPSFVSRPMGDFLPLRTGQLPVDCINPSLPRVLEAVSESISPPRAAQ